MAHLAAPAGLEFRNIAGKFRRPAQPVRLPSSCRKFTRRAGRFFTDTGDFSFLIEYYLFAANGFT
ncbi:hypothetical protein BEN74_11270 [Acinetobacter sp. WCHAc010034]|uniref:hypothetical protein n=1 Tax=Acinetobacter sp. WCHAc010034 TaxID=1879049 RepID=UPI00083AD973|nr:hypothetical protein [Acinetobacter sp. WCHAc010034]AYA03352.1 hypothetical protein BEN74_11270 [Acinetobacter sp. WCHAc010034]